jgi:hypothetical protein
MKPSAQVIQIQYNLNKLSFFSLVCFVRFGQWQL